jgi:chromosome segregation ATPase
MKFKRAIKGYRRAWIDETINSLNSEYSREIEKLKENLSSLSKENEVLRGEIELLGRDIEQYKQIEDDMAKALLKVHLAASRQVHDVIEKAEEQENKRLETISKYKKEKSELKDALKNLSAELKSKVEEYRFKLETFAQDKGEEADVK